MVKKKLFQVKSRTWSQISNHSKAKEVVLHASIFLLPYYKGTDSHKVVLVMNSGTDFKLTIGSRRPNVPAIGVAKEVATAHKGKIGHWNTIDLHGCGIFVDKLLSLDRV
jgi:hypothetical protein